MMSEHSGKKSNRRHVRALATMGAVVALGVGWVTQDQSAALVLPGG